MGGILIVGQGLAGTLVAWELERAGVSFEIVDQGHARSASRVAAGIINPITGQRLVKSWRVEQLWPVANETYRALEQTLGVGLWTDVRVRRVFADARERELLAARRAKGLLGNYVSSIDDTGAWVENAARVDLAALISAARQRWLATGQLREGRIAMSTAEIGSYDLVIDCRGAHAVVVDDGPASRQSGERIKWRVSKGECLDVLIDGLDPQVLINRGHWVLPTSRGRAKVGATHAAGVYDWNTTSVARAELAISTAALTGRPFEVVNHEAGIRVYVDDKRPVVGRDPGNPRRGFLNALGAKGALLAPALARQWADHLTRNRGFDSAVAVARCWSLDA